MLVSVVAIGNSRGIRLPKAVLDQLNISDKVDMAVENQQIVLRPVVIAPRSGWAMAFQEMHINEHDKLVMPETANTKDFEWEW